jgi:hypothetical protein
MMNWKGLLYSRYYPEICLEGPKINAINFRMYDVPAQVRTGDLMYYDKPFLVLMSVVVDL